MQQHLKQRQLKRGVNNMVKSKVVTAGWGVMDGEWSELFVRWVAWCLGRLWQQPVEQKKTLYISFMQIERRLYIKSDNSDSSHLRIWSQHVLKDDTAYVNILLTIYQLHDVR